jgi:alpha-ribazole phosphatase/probable phosphoglycerate mutase
MERLSRLIFVRHAETDMAGRFCGLSDPELNERGRAQLETLIDRLRGEQFHKIFTSDLTRARQTAHAISSHFGLESIGRPGLREIYFGEWEGLSWSEIESRDLVLAKRWVLEYPNVPAPAGETFPNFEARVRRETEFLLQQAAQFPLLVVTHAGFLRVALTCRYVGAKKEALENTPDYAAVISTDSQALALSMGLHRQR